MGTDDAAFVVGSAGAAMTIVLQQLEKRPGRLARAFRILIGFVYLFGAPTHVYFGIADPDGYRGMSEFSPPITSISRTFWESWFIPNARVLALLLAAGELAIAVLILGRARWTRPGLVAATLFHMALAAIFGMWVYTLPMIAILAYCTTLSLDDGPFAHILRRPPKVR